MTRINRWVSAQLGRATAPQNLDDERVGGINQAYAWSKSFSDRFSGVVKQWKRKHPKAYRVMRPVLAAVVVGRWCIGCLVDGFKNRSYERFFMTLFFRVTRQRLGSSTLPAIAALRKRR